MTAPRSALPGQPHQDHKPVSQRLWLIGIVADVAAVLAVLAGSPENVAVVVGTVALLLGAVQLATSVGKPVDRWVLLAVLGLLAGAVTVSVVATRTLVATPGRTNGAVAGTTSGAPGAVTGATSGAAEAPEEFSIGRETGNNPIALTAHYGVDLDSDKPLWIAEKVSGSGSGIDLKSDAGYLWAEAGIAPTTPQATLEQCRRAGYETSANAEQFVTDAAFCVQSNQGAYARVIIKSKTDGQALLDVVVWRKQTR